MQRKDGEKPQYAFTQGLVTEQSPVNVVEGSVLDISNFVIQRDGSLRRRRAITLEEGGVPFILNATVVGDEAFQSYTWRAAGGDPGRVIQVIQFGTDLYFFNDDETLSDNFIGTFSLTSYQTPAITLPQLRQSAVSMSDGKGSLFVASKFAEPLYVTILGNIITAHMVQILQRDFHGVEDGLTWTYKPPTLTDAHKYNLANRGWAVDRYDQFKTDIGVYPGKNMIPYAGLARGVDPAVQEGFGTNEWNSAKLAAEFFGDSSAPTGRLFLNPFDTTASQSSGGDDSIGTVAIIMWTNAGSTVTVNTDQPHGRTTGQTVAISGNQWSMQVNAGRTAPTITGSFDGVHNITVVDPTTFSFTYSFPANFMSWVNKYISLGVVVGTAGDTSPILIREGGYTTFQRPQATAFWAGRVWWAGIAHPQLADVLFFSQIVETPSQYGSCYQKNDPTAQNFNTLLPTDGGTIKVAGLYGVLDMKVLGGSLVIYTTGGIWEVTGGQAGFTASDYRVRKITDAEVVGKTAITRIDSSHCAATRRGIFAIGYDTNSGYVSAQDISSSKIKTFWNDIPEAVKSQMVMSYDDAQKKVYFSYGTAATPRKLTKSLVFGADIGKDGAYFLLTLPYGESTGYTVGHLALDSADNANQSKKIKFITVPLPLSTTIYFNDMQNDLYIDVTGTEDLPYVTFAHDNTGDWSKRKYVAQYVYVFMNKTETGYIEQSDSQLVPLNPSFLTLQGRWDWADHINSGKFSQKQQVYRHRREYTPVDVNDKFDNGEPVVVTRNKLRGSGRALQLRFEGGPSADAHLLGWAIEYGVTR